MSDCIRCCLSCLSYKWLNTWVFIDKWLNTWVFLATTMWIVLDFCLCRIFLIFTSYLRLLYIVLKWVEKVKRKTRQVRNWKANIRQMKKWGIGDKINETIMIWLAILVIGGVCVYVCVCYLMCIFVINFRFTSLINKGRSFQQDGCCFINSMDIDFIKSWRDC